MGGRYPGGAGPAGYGADSGEVDYGDGGEYTIGGQRVMADFDDFGSPGQGGGGGGGQQWSPGQGAVRKGGRGT